MWRVRALAPFLIAKCNEDEFHVDQEVLGPVTSSLIYSLLWFMPLMLLVGPQSEAEWDQDAEAKRDAKHKETVLRAHEMMMHHGVAAERPATPKSR